MPQQITLRELAKQGDVKAIAFLLNSSLQPKGIKAKVNLKDYCLDIFLESGQTIDQQEISSWLHKAILNLDIANINSIKIYGKIGNDSANWKQTIELKKDIDSSFTTKSINHNSEIKTTTKDNRKKYLLIASIAAVVLVSSISETVLWLRNMQIQTIVKAQNLVSNLEHNNDLDLETLKTNQAQLNQVVKILDQAPILPIPGSVNSQLKAEKNKIFTRLESVEQNINKLENVRSEMKAIIDEFSALNSRLDVGMSYREYNSTISDIKVALDRFARQPEATRHPIYNNLEDAFKKYDFALNVWRNYIESDNYSKFFPASSYYGTVLVAEYQVETNEILGEEYVYLNTALAKVWSIANENVEAAQKQLASKKKCISNCTPSPDYLEDADVGEV